MAKIILNESQFKGYLKKLHEEEYASEINVGDFNTPDEANAFLAMIRQKYGFSDFDSWVRVNSVFVMVEKDNTDDSYFYDIIDSVRNDAKASAYRQVCENKKANNNMGNKIKISESNLHDIIGNAIMEALKFQRSLGQKSPKGNVGPKDSNLNFFVTIGSGANRRIIGDKGFKTREAAERKAESLRKQGKEGVSIIKKMVAESDASLSNERALRKIVSESVKKVLNEWDEDGDSYYGGGLPDSFSKDEMPQKFNDEEETGEKVFIVFEKNCQVNCVCKSKETAIKKSDKIYGFFEQWTLLD